MYFASALSMLLHPGHKMMLDVAIVEAARIADLMCEQRKLREDICGAQ